MKRFRRIALIIIGLILAVVLVGPFLVPVPPLEGTVPPEQLADSDSRFIDVDGLRVHYKTSGDGSPTFVLLHGFGASVFSWREVMTPLSESGTVIAFDRPAFGLTERPLRGDWDGESPYSPEAQIELTVKLMDQLGVDEAILVGNSAGGTIAMATALEHPDRVLAVVLVDAAIYTGGGTPDWVRPLLGTPQMRRIGPLLARSIQNLGPNLIERAWHDPSKISAEILEGYTKPLKVDNWDVALWELTLASHSLGLDRRVRDIRVPVLVITGDDDRIVPTEQSVRLDGELPDAELVVIPNCGHVPQEECPAEFTQAIVDYLPQLTGSASLSGPQ